MPLNPLNSLRFDAVIVGGGIAGLWILNRLRREGYNAILLEQEALGAGQTIASQGMIHGGVKYTLAGALSGASEAIAEMPDYWRACLAGKGALDLRQTRTLSDHFYMWSTESSLSKITGFLASKTLRGRVEAVAAADRPPLFQHSAFRGTLYQLVDSVIDTASLLQNLASAQPGRIFKVGAEQVRWHKERGVVSLVLTTAAGEQRIEAGQFVLAAGQGNGALLQHLQASRPEMQLRPLQQVMVKHHHPHRLYAHCVGSDSTPRLTISSHGCADGALCWYLGGQLAERGVDKKPAALIAEARSELMALFPWLDWSSAQWATYPVARAEARQKNFVRPDNAFLERATDGASGQPFANVLVAWPTKLTLAPHLGEEALRWLQQLAISAASTNGDPAELDLPPAAIAESPWDKAEWST